jgi:hypothetical protein
MANLVHRAHPTPDRFGEMSLADETVSGEPVCIPNSLLTGKSTGNFGIMAHMPQASNP